MFTTKIFSVADIEERGLLQTWLNGIRIPGYGIKIVSQVVIPETADSVTKVLTTISTWKLGEMGPGAASARTTIDEIPAEVSIEYPED